MNETNETSRIGWTELDVEPDFPAALSTLRRLGKQQYHEAQALYRWVLGQETAPRTAGDIERAVRSVLGEDVDDMVNAIMNTLKDEVTDALTEAVEHQALDCSEDSWQEVLDEEGQAETIRQLCTEAENNVDQVMPDLDLPCLVTPMDLERRVAESLKRPEEPYVVKLAKRIHGQTGLPRPVVAKMLEPFTYAGPVRDRLLKYAEEDVQTAAHLDFDVFR